MIRLSEMKTTIDIPKDFLTETKKHTGARTKSEAILIALEQFNRWMRLEGLADRLYGSMPNLMTHKDLRKMRTNRIRRRSQSKP
jgi:Arc/MetJ family transcription regulator